MSSRQSMFEKEEDSDDSVQRVNAENFIRVASNRGEFAIEKLESLVKTLSNANASQFPSAIDPDDFDLQAILKGFVNGITERGLKLRSSGVVLDNVSTIGNDNSIAYAPTLLDLVPNPLAALKKTPQRKILNNINGFVKSGEMCLVLGRPGAGCSTFLRTVTGETHHYKGVDGRIIYDGIPHDEMVKDFKSELIYNPEYDEHFPHLTVKQTLKFAVACRTPATRPKGVSREEYINVMVDMLGTVFGLRHTFGTKVGNDVIRGVSGGERKRVSIAEALSARAAVYGWDNATRGLDSSTALEYAQAIRTTTNLLRSVSFVTLYQASENIFTLFDKVTVLYEGRQIFFGPVEKARQFFIDMGYEPLNRQSTSEFLTSITDPLGRFAREGFEHKVPLTPREFEDYWLKSEEYKLLVNEIKDQESIVDAESTKQLFKESLALEKSKHQKVSSKYTISYPAQLKLLVGRAVNRVLGDPVFMTVQCIFITSIAFIIGSMFWNIPGDTSGAFSKGGLVFFVLIYFIFNVSQELVLDFQSRPIIQRHRSYSFYAPSAEAIAEFLIDFPVKLVTIFIFIIIGYFLGNLKRTGGNFFSFLLFAYVTVMAVKALYKTVAAFSPTLSIANSVGGLLLIALVLYSSFMIQVPDMHPWFVWLAHINPSKYGFESMLAPQFHGEEMNCSSEFLIPNGEEYTQFYGTDSQVCAFTGSELGNNYISGSRYIKTAFGYSMSHVWRNFGILIGFLIFFVATLIFFSEWMKFGEGNGDRLLFEKGRIPEEFTKTEDQKDVEAAGVTEDGLRLTKSKRDAAIFEGEDLGTDDVFTWKNLDYTIKLKGGEERKLLENVQGYVKPGELVALMGESGAGKTTLLNVLSNRVDTGVVTGDMLVNGLPVDQTFKKRTGYVQQQDLHLSELTVRESLIFAARLRRPASVPDEEKLAYVEKMIKILDMEQYSDAIVGEPGNGLNVEQRKKLSIGVELVAKPSLLLFLDEPSSGLDSQSSWAVIQVLKHLAQAGQAILCTIHQPSATLFEQFDKLLLLKKGGKTVYFGDVGDNSRTLLDYFERQGGRKCETLENPAEYILEVIGAGATAHVEEDWYDKWEKSPEYVQVGRDIEDIIKSTGSISHSEDDKALRRVYNSSWFSQFYYVFHRTLLQFWRDPGYITAKFGLYTIAGLFMGFTFWDIGTSVAGLQQLMFVAFLTIVMSNPIQLQMQDKAVSSRVLYETRESKSNTFHWSVLLFAQIIVEYGFNLIGATLFFLTSYYPLKVDQSSSMVGRFYLLSVIIYQIYSATFAIGTYYFSPDLPSAGMVSSVVNIFTFAFAGVLQPVTLMPGFWTFVHKVSPATYVIEALATTLVHGRPVHCKKKELSYFDAPDGLTCGDFMESYISKNGGYLTDPSSTGQCGFCPYDSADVYYATQRNFYSSHFWRNFGFMFAYIIFNVVSILILYWVFHDAGAFFAKRKAAKANAKAKNVEQKA